MSFRARVVIAALWIASVFGVGAVAAQMRQIVPLPSPRVVAGPDVGFRVEGQLGETPVGKIVVKINGQWVEAQLGGVGTGVTPAASH